MEIGRNSFRVKTTPRDLETIVICISSSETTALWRELLQLEAEIQTKAAIMHFLASNAP